MAEDLNKMEVELDEEQLDEVAGGFMKRSRPAAEKKPGVKFL